MPAFSYEHSAQGRPDKAGTSSDENATAFMTHFFVCAPCLTLRTVEQMYLFNDVWKAQKTPAGHQHVGAKGRAFA
jgi:hypothetical protein